MLWFSFAVMLLAAALVVVWPVYQRQRRFSLVSAVTVIGIVALSTGLYSKIGTPDTDAAGPDVSSIEDMVRSLDARLQEKPNDLKGWKMLGRSYMQLGKFPQAIVAFEKAVELEDSQNAETLISLGEAVLTHDKSSINKRAGQLFESGLAIAPSSPRALFYAGLAAAARGDNVRAANRWEALLAQSPPPQIEGILRQRVAEWRGELVAPPAPTVSAGDASGSVVVSIDISLGDDAAESVLPSASVFIIARDPAQPSPPLAVARRKASELPAVVGIGDSDAMIPGRLPSAYDSLEIIVRISASGQPIAQPGDWYGERLVMPAENGLVTIVVDQQVP